MTLICDEEAAMRRAVEALSPLAPAFPEETRS